MGGTKKAGKGGGGGGQNRRGRNCDPSERVVLRKDPGLPSAAIKKAGQQMESTKAAREGRREQRSKAKRDIREAASGGGSSSSAGDPSRKEASNMAALMLNAQRRQVQFDEINAEAEALRQHTDASGSAKARDVTLRRFYKDFRNVVDQSDVVLEVLDARDPMGCRLQRLEQWISSQWGTKKTIVLLLNKADLLPGGQSTVVAQWETYFKQENMHCIPFTTKQDSGSSACNARLFKLLRKIARGDSDARKSITVGVVGYPNVGKSSVINALKRKHVVGVGNTPGFTTGPTEVDLRSDVKIIDSPGVVMPGEDTGDVVLRNAMKVDQLENPVAVVCRLFERSDRASLAALYGVPVPAGETIANTVDAFLTTVGWKKGRVRQGGSIDDTETARIVLKDWNDGRIGYFTVPPESHELHMNVLSGVSAGFVDESGGAVAVGDSLTKTMFNASNLPRFQLRAVGSGGGLLCGTSSGCDAPQSASAEPPAEWGSSHVQRRQKRICFNPLDAIDGDYESSEDEAAVGDNDADDDDDAPTSGTRRPTANKKTGGSKQRAAAFWTAPAQYEFDDDDDDGTAQ